MFFPVRLTGYMTITDTMAEKFAMSVTFYNFISPTTPGRADVSCLLSAYSTIQLLSSSSPSSGTICSDVTLAGTRIVSP